jgi:hypothetical protein
MPGISTCRGGCFPVRRYFGGSPPVFRPSFPPAAYASTRRQNPKISNREPLRLETHVTHTKQIPGHHSNRENNACFSIRVRAVNRLCDCTGIDSPRPAFGHLSTQGSSRPNPIRRKAAKNPKTFKTHPSFLFRLKPAPIVCFPTLTRQSNRTMFRLGEEKEAPREQRQPAAIASSQAQTQC